MLDQSRQAYVHYVTTILLIYQKTVIIKKWREIESLGIDHYQFLYRKVIIRLKLTVKRYQENRSFPLIAGQYGSEYQFQ